MLQPPSPMKPKLDKLKDAGNFHKGVGPFIGLGLQLAVTVTAMVFLGIWLDEQFDTKPILIIIFSLFGVFAGLYNFIKSAMKAGNDKK